MPWGGWEALKIAADGSFSGNVTGPPAFFVGNTYTTIKLSIQGNAKSKDMRIESLDYYHCSWKGIIS
jgi:hypothetical protein